MNTSSAAVSDTAERAAQLVTEHGAAVGQACMALLGSQRDAEHVLRETLVAALGQTRAPTSGPATRVWLLGEARRRCAERSASRPAAESRALPGASATAEKDASHARALLARLKPTEREALVFGSIGELELSRVALACGTDEKAAVQRASHALIGLCESFGEEA